MRNKTLYTISLICASLFVWLLVVFAFTNEFTFRGSEEEAQQATVAVETIEDGTYEGVGQGHEGEIKVAVEVADGVIQSVDVLEQGETEGIADPALDEIPSAIVEENSADVEAVAGATFTSKGIMEAVNDALGQVESAGADVDYVDGTYTGVGQGHEGDVEVEVTVEDGKINHVTVLEHDETDGIADLALKQVPSEIVANNSSEVEVVSGATYTSNAIMDATAEALADAGEDSAEAEATDAEDTESDEKDQENKEDEDKEVTIDLDSLEDGLYEGEGQGHGGKLIVEVEVKDHKIVAVEVTDHDETDGISDPALDQLPEAIVKANGVDEVEVVSQATETSEAIIAAVEEALTSEPKEDAAEESKEESSESEESKDESDAETTVTYKDGKYKGIGEGFNDKIEVEVEVKDHKIVAIEILKSEETEGISDLAFDRIPEAIIEKNSTDIELDAVSGATNSAKGIIEAVEDALKKAE